MHKKLPIPFNTDLNALISQNATKFLCDNHTLLFQYFNDSVISLLNSKKRICISCHSHSEEIEYHLANILSNEVVCRINESEHRLSKGKFNNELLQALSKDFYLIHNKLMHKLNFTINIHDKIDETIFGKSSYYDLVEYLSFVPVQNVPILPCHSNAMTYQEYNLVKIALKECALMQESFHEFDPFDDSLYKKIILSDDEMDQIENIIENLLDMKHRVGNIKQLLSNTLQEYSNKWVETFQQEFVDIVKSKFEYYEKLTAYLHSYNDSQIQKPSLLNFNNQDKLKYEAWLSLNKYYKEFILNLQKISWLKLSISTVVDIASMKDLESQLNAQLENFHSRISNILSEKINRINAINSDNVNLASTLTELQQIASEFNQIPFATQLIEVNTNSSVRHLQICKNLELAIHSLLKELSVYPDTHRWHKSMIKLNKDHQLLLKEIMLFPLSDRESVLESYFYNEIKNSKYDPFMAFLTEEHQSLASLCTQFQSLKLQLAQQNALWLKHQSSSQLQISNPKLYKKALNNETLTSPESDIFECVYPIMFSNKSNHRYDAYIVVDNNSFSITTNIPSQETKFVIHDLNNIAIQNIQSLNQCNSTQKINLARDIAKVLLTNSANVRLFQLRSANVITTLSNSCTDYLLDKLYDDGVKETNILDNEFDGLVASILDTSRPQYILIQDGLLNAHNSEDLLIQLDILDQIQKAGFQIICLTTQDLFTNRIIALDNIANKLSPISYNIKDLHQEITFPLQSELLL